MSAATPSREADLTVLRAVATAAVDAAAAELTGRRDAARSVWTKQGHALVSDADLAAERAALAVLRERTPGYAVLSEEESSSAAGAPDGGTPTWILDPLDGTTNYVRGLPDFAVALALVADGETVLAVVRLPAHAAPGGTGTHVAVAGRGAYRDGTRLSVSGRGPGRPLAGTGFGTEGVVRERQRSVADRLLRAGVEIREPGSASVGLCRVATGSYDGYLEFGIGAWDTAPGALLVREAGGLVTGWGGTPFVPADGHLVAAAPHVHSELVAAGGAHRPIVVSREEERS